jgi:hypothetical protein
MTRRVTVEVFDPASTREIISPRNRVASFYNFGRTEERSPPRTFRLLLRLFVVTGTCLPNRCLAMEYSTCIRYYINVCYFRSNQSVWRTVVSLDYSDFQPSCNNNLSTFISITEMLNSYLRTFRIFNNLLYFQVVAYINLFPTLQSLPKMCY